MQKILVVDDDFDLRTIVSDLLSAHQFEVAIASNGEEALEKARVFVPQLILLDISMPSMDGFTVVKRLHEIPELQNVPVIAFTAHALKGDSERALANGYNGYISKPFRPDELVATIKTFLAVRKAA